MEKTKIAIVVSHPIQHFCPQYASFARDPLVSLKVFFGSALGAKPYFDPNFKKEITWSNLHLEEFDHVFLNGDDVIPADRHLDSVALGTELSEFAPDVLICYGYFQKIQRRARQWAIKNKVKMAYISDSEMRQNRNWLKEWLKYFWVRNYFSSIDFFLTVGDANEQFYKFYGAGDEQLVRMHFPIDVKLYEGRFRTRESLRRDIRKRYGIGDDEKVLLVVGKLVPWKNQDHIIKAIRILETNELTLHLWVAGSGEMLDSWTAVAGLLQHSKVHFMGFVDTSELPACYAGADVYVHPAAVEPHSIAISEAIYMGLPIIASDRTGSYGDTDDLQPGKNGLVYKWNDIDALASCIDKLACDEALRQAYSEHSHGQALAFQQCAHHDVVAKIVALSQGQGKS
jgi:glycosyltransferase involved in cell wall biosynthesis